MPDFDPVHTKPEGFENASLFLRLGSPSSLIRNEDGVLIYENAFQPGVIKKRRVCLLKWTETFWKHDFLARVSLKSKMTAEACVLDEKHLMHF